MSLYQKIIALYPQLTDFDFSYDGTITLQNDGAEDYIAKWNHPTLSRPTDEQLGTV